MNVRRRLIVILEQGKVVGTQLSPGGAPPAAELPPAGASLLAGPRQTRHEISALVPASFKTDAARKRFHAELAARIAGQSKA
jgi:hypothetical protein